MALEAIFRNLSVCLLHLHDALNALQVTLGDKPADDESALADGVEAIVLDILGALHEAQKAALDSRKSVSHSIDFDRARHALMICQERFHRIEQQFASDLVSYEKLKQLTRLGNARRAWLAWSRTVKQGIEQCQPPLEQTSAALAACWQELVEHSGTTSISVKNTGQKIIARRPLNEEEAIGERMT